MYNCRHAPQCTATILLAVRTTLTIPCQLILSPQYRPTLTWHYHVHGHHKLFRRRVQICRSKPDAFKNQHQQIRSTSKTRQSGNSALTHTGIILKFHTHWTEILNTGINQNFKIISISKFDIILLISEFQKNVFQNNTSFHTTVLKGFSLGSPAYTTGLYFWYLR